MGQLEEEDEGGGVGGGGVGGGGVGVGGGVGGVVGQLEGGSGYCE